MASAISPSITASLPAGRTLRSTAVGVAVSVAAVDTFVLTINHGLPTTPDEIRPILRTIGLSPSVAMSSPPQLCLLLANASIVQFGVPVGNLTASLYDFVCEVTHALVK